MAAPDTAESLRRVRTRIPLRWRDFDALGHLNQSVYHVFLEEGRTALFLDESGAVPFAFVLARVELDYRHEVRHADGHVTVDAWVERIGTSSVTIGHEVLRADDSVAASGRTVVVAWDTETRGARPLNDEERARLRA